MSPKYVRILVALIAALGLGPVALMGAALLPHGLIPTAAAQTATPPPATAAKTPAPAAALPGGATSLQESYQDWSVACILQTGVRRCTMSQQQQNPQSRQRVLGIELAGLSPDRADGILVLPFGLAFDVGVTLQVDTTPAGSPLRFRTCLPAGCIVPISFDARTLALLRKSATLAVKASADRAGEASFAVSLKGFGSAFDRMIALAH